MTPQPAPAEDPTMSEQLTAMDRTLRAANRDLADATAWREIGPLTRAAIVGVIVAAWEQHRSPTGDPYIAPSDDPVVLALFDLRAVVKDHQTHLGVLDCTCVEDALFRVEQAAGNG